MRYKKIVPAEKASDFEKRKKNIKTLIYFIISFSVIFGLFEGLVAIEFKPVYPIYLIILTILLVLFLFFNKGFSSARRNATCCPNSGARRKRTVFICAGNMTRRLPVSY